MHTHAHTHTHTHTQIFLRRSYLIAAFSAELAFCLPCERTPFSSKHARCSLTHLPKIACSLGTCACLFSLLKIFRSSNIFSHESLLPTNTWVLSHFSLTLSLCLALFVAAAERSSVASTPSKTNPIEVSSCSLSLPNVPY